MPKKSNKGATPAVPPVKTPEELEIEALELELEAAEAPVADPVVEIPPAPIDKTNTILCEDGSRIAVYPMQEKAYRVQSVDGSNWDHCSDALDGEWVYRRV